jgi:hypothetical protein
MDKINSFLPLKPDSISMPEMYLGAKLKRKTFDDGTLAWGLPLPSVFNKLLGMSRHTSRTISKGGFPCQSEETTHSLVIMPQKRMLPHCLSLLWLHISCS